MIGNRQGQRAHVHLSDSAQRIDSVEEGNLSVPGRQVDDPHHRSTAHIAAIKAGFGSGATYHRAKAVVTAGKNTPLGMASAALAGASWVLERPTLV